MSNPLSCNCHLSWFLEWLRARDILVGSLTCYFPQELRDKPFLQVEPEQLICEGKV